MSSVTHGSRMPAERTAPARLFSSLALGHVTLANRLVVAPMTRVSAAEDGRVTDRMAAYYEEFARGGWGLIETEGTYIDEEHSRCKPRQPGIATGAQADAWRPVVDVVHAAGAAIFIQLQHAGALAEPCAGHAGSVAPSVVEPRSRKPLLLPRALSRAGISRVCAHFACAAARAVDAGFDGVELHGANGYLIDQFLTDYTNLRTDDYGGPTANRVRFAAEVLRAVRDAVPRAFPVGIRLTEAKTADPHCTWRGGDADAVTIFEALGDAGASFLHIGGERHAAGARRPRCALAKAVTAAVVIANGGLEDPARGEALLESRGADLIALARGALANPDWPRRVAAARPLASYDPAMIQPTPTLDNADHWRRGQAR